MRAMVVVVPFILGQDLPEVLFAVDQTTPDLIGVAVRKPRGASRACLLRRYRLDPCDLTDLFGGALVVDVGEIGGDEAAVVRFTLCG
jgi:hypothetical protein